MSSAGVAASLAGLAAATLGAAVRGQCEARARRRLVGRPRPPALRPPPAGDPLRPPPAGDPLRPPRAGDPLRRAGRSSRSGGVTPSPAGAVQPAVAAALCAVGGSAAGLAVGGPALAVVGLAVGAGGWRWWWGRAAQRRLEAVDAELPVVLEAVAARLRAGGSLAQALVESSPPPGGLLAEQWRRMAELIPAVGVAGALDDWGARCRRLPVRLAAAALALAAETGGSPARAVDGVAATVRARQALAAELRALTAQARASATVIALAPVAFAALAAAADPRTAAFLRSPVGTVLVGAGLGLDALGAWWMARLCRLRGQQ